MAKQYKLNKYKEDRGDLYVIEASDYLNLDTTNYYILEGEICLTDLQCEDKMLIIRGEVNINDDVIKKGILLSDLEITKKINTSTDSIIILMTECEYDFKIIPKPDFKIKRIFFVDNMPVNSIRGEHAHKDETEYLYVINGEFEVYIRDLKEIKSILCKGDVALSLPKAWTSVKSLDKHGILLALLSHKYNPKGFIN